MNNQMAINTYISISLGANGLNAPIKRITVNEYIKKQDQYICCLQETISEQKSITD